MPRWHKGADWSTPKKTYRDPQTIQEKARVSENKGVLEEGGGPAAANESGILTNVFPVTEKTVTKSFKTR